MNGNVKAWIEHIIIPTYPIGKAEKNPMFLEKRVYQGSSGVVYPHAVVEKIADEKTDRSYQAVFLENQYIRIMILPELGGRIQMAYDKVKERHFIYYNQVIKPALVGLTGPWISGGIEFNWPQHHRPSTFEPVDFTMEENADGSKTVWVNEVERMFRTKGMAGFTLYPDKAYIEIRGKLYNRTPFPQTFLWWANPAVKVNDDYQSVFPPDVYAVFDHGKRDVSSFPIAKGVYYKVDYAPGTDISRYKNIPVPTSYMAIQSKYNFIGGYEHDTNGGLLHVADHHVSPGKKQWTWGYGDFGKSWDRNLTDEDGPYIELMTGMFTDNQPDFSWLQPYEEKTFVQYFMPYREVGMVKNATKEAVLGVYTDAKGIELRLHVTAAYTNVEIAVKAKDRVLFSEMISVSPLLPYLKSVTGNETAGLQEFEVLVTDKDTKKQLVSYREEKIIEKEMPLPAEAAKSPSEVENNEQLFLTGLHLEQYRHATFSPVDYYREALRRDEKDIRCNNAMGLWLLRRGQFVKSAPYFRKAIETLTQRNPNPFDGEVFYNLGWCLKMQGLTDEAFDLFYKAVWNDAWQQAGYLNLAGIACEKGDFEEALDFINKSLLRNYHSHSARLIKAVVLRKLGKSTETKALLSESLEIDPFNYGCLYEQYLWYKADKEEEKAASALSCLLTRSRNWVHNFIEYAFDYAHAGLYREAMDFLQVHIDQAPVQYPMVYYYMGWLADKEGETILAGQYFQKAAILNPDYCFPNRMEDVPVLTKALSYNPDDAKALYYLGNFWYDKRQYEEAIQCWERSAVADPRFPTVQRNLSLACYNKLHNPERALEYMEHAFQSDPADARVLMELDQLYRKLNKPHRQRLDLLESYLPLVESRDDLYLERIALYNLIGEYQSARELTGKYKFHPWEGGEGKVVGQYLISHIELAKEALANKKGDIALQLLEEAGTYPDNLGEGKLYGVQENDIYYLKALAYELSGNMSASNDYLKKATEGISIPVQAIFYNDPQPDKIFYQGLAWAKLGDRVKADAIFNTLIRFGEEHINDPITIDYFAVSLPDLLVFDADLNERNRIHCLYLQGLGYLGLGAAYGGYADTCFAEVLKLDINHIGAVVHRNWVNLK